MTGPSRRVDSSIPALPSLTIPQPEIANERICDMGLLDEYAEGFRKVALLASSLLDSVDQVVPIYPEMQNIQSGVTDFANVLNTVNFFALCDWWVNGKRVSAQNTAFMGLSTVLQAALSAKFIARLTLYVADKLGKANLFDLGAISSYLGSIPVIGQGLGILEILAYSFNAWHHTKKIKQVKAKMVEHNATIAKVQCQHIVLRTLARTFQTSLNDHIPDVSVMAKDAHAELQKSIADQISKEDAEVTQYLPDGKLKLAYLHEKFQHKVKVLSCKKERLKIKQSKFRMSLLNDISHIAFTILTMLGTVLLATGVAAAYANPIGISIAMFTAVVFAISLIKLMQHKYCDRNLEKQKMPPVPHIVLMAEHAASLKRQITMPLKLAAA